MAQQVLDRYGNHLEEFTLIPGGGGVFEITINGKLRFSKKSLGRFPEDEEVFRLIDSN